ncbi:MAG TPA: TlpA disulfide reductase family protein [Gemmatimonadales bacterium]|nr:TlpA disulfide reductase family protein [Gemmatimonadales bacterium]
MRGKLTLALFCAGSITIAGNIRAQESGIAVGSAAPAVSVRDLDGNTVDLGQYIGKKPMLLEFWATWCELCEELLPRIRAAKAAYGSAVEFIGINVTVNQTPARVQRYLQEHQPPFRTLYDDEGASTRAYQVPATSYVVIVDRAGKVAYTGSGGIQDLDTPLRRVTRK